MPTLTKIDHIHLYVPSRSEAASWFADVLGFRVAEPLRFWATDGGPLTIENESGSVHLALFKRDKAAPSTAIAFGVDGTNWLEWKKVLETRGILDRFTDHTLAWSLYFHDPYKNLYEITTYDHAVVSKALGAG